MGSVEENPQRELRVTLDRNTSRNLGNSNYQLQVAKSVINPKGQLTFNIVWQSRVLAPMTSLGWTPIYGFNWTTSIPTPGLQITCEGEWMECNIGQVLDIDQYGYFNISAATPDPSSMKIGKNGYHSQADGGVIHIIVGILNQSTGNFDACFVDPAGLYPNMSGTWQPQEKVQWWYESGARTATMLSQRDSSIETGDFSAPDPATGTFRKESAYNSSRGTWITKSVAVAA